MAESNKSLQNWRTLYCAALLEADKSKLAWRIEEARRALRARSRELFASFPDDSETEAIEDAIYALGALESCLRLNTEDRRRAPRAS